MNARALCLGQFIAATDFGVPGVVDSKEPTFTLGRCARESIADMKKVGKEVEKGIVYFSDYNRGWVMNKTNLQCLIALFGEDTEGWGGKRVTLNTAMTNTGLGIRVKGSPDITADMKVVIKLPKKAPITMTLVPTGPRREPDARTVAANAPISEENFALWIKAAKEKRNWTDDNVADLLASHGAADGLPGNLAPEKRRDVVAVLKGNPPAPAQDDGPPDDGAPE